MRDKCTSIIRSHLTAGGTVVSAGILALGLVIATPDSDDMKSEVHAVQLAAYARNPALPSAAQLKRLIGNHAQNFEFVIPVTKDGADTTGAIATVTRTPPAGATAESGTDPDATLQRVGNATLAATPNPLAISGGIFAPVVAVVGILLLFGPLIVLVILACPICAIVNELSYFLPLPTLPLAAAAVPTAKVEGEATSTPELTDEPVINKVSASLAATEEPADAQPVVKPRKADVASPTASTEPATEHETQPTELKESEQAGSEAPPEADKRVRQPATPRRVVRESLGAGEQSGGPPRHGHEGRQTGKSAEPSDAAPSAANRSPTDKESSDGGPAGGDADDSE